METITIRGGKPLNGSVTVRGSKNDTVAIMAGALLVPGKTTLLNVPKIKDVYTLIEIFRRIGADTNSTFFSSPVTGASGS